jgi:hypothetical protein
MYEGKRPKFTTLATFSENLVSDDREINRFVLVDSDIFSIVSQNFSDTTD